MYSDSILLNFIYQNARFGIIISDNIKENISVDNVLPSCSSLVFKRD